MKSLSMPLSFIFYIMGKQTPTNIYQNKYMGRKQKQQMKHQNKHQM